VAGKPRPAGIASGITVTRNDGFAELEPFGLDWPGLAPAGDGQDADEFADQNVRDNDDGTSRLILVAAARSADVLTAAGWDGAVNYIQPKSVLSCVLRSWEERFGARVIEIGFDTLHLTVAAPPVSPGHAEQVAAEHLAFCPDNIVAGMSRAIRDYAADHVLGKADWWFWWD